MSTTSYPPEFEKSSASELSDHLLMPSVSIEPDLEEQQVFLDEDILPQAGATVGERQPPEYRDAWFAVAFLIQLVVVLFVAFYWGFPALGSSSTSSNASSSSSSSGQKTLPYKSDSDTASSVGWLYVLLLSGFVAVALSALALYIMARYAKQVIQICALIYLFVSLVLMVQFLLTQMFVGAVVMLIVFLIGGWYFWSVQNRIHFAASNLVTASQAIRSNLGILLVAFAMVWVSLLWSALWLVALNGANVKTSHCDEYDSSKTCISMHYNTVVVALLLLSFYWTHQVILNIVHVTVAGVVATFWFAPNEASSFCSPSVWDSWRRASTSSLGSIAFGSLLVAILQWLQHSLRALRRRQGHSLLSCVAEFIVKVLEELMEYFNKWVRCSNRQVFM
jgi:hypothetical protein